MNNMLPVKKSKYRGKPLLLSEKHIESKADQNHADGDNREKRRKNK